MTSDRDFTHTCHCVSIQTVRFLNTSNVSKTKEKQWCKDRKEQNISTEELSTGGNGIIFRPIVNTLIDSCDCFPQKTRRRNTIAGPKIRAKHAAAREANKLQAKKSRIKGKTVQMTKSSKKQQSGVLSDRGLIDQLRRMVRGELVVCSDETREYVYFSETSATFPLMSFNKQQQIQHVCCSRL